MEFRVLGPLEVRPDNGRPAVPARRKQRLLLGMLCLHPNQVVSRDTVIDWLWGEAPPASAVANLQSSVSELRKLIGKDRLRTGKDGYLLKIADDELDAASFERLVKEGKAAVRAGRPVVAVQQFGRALALWRDDVLCGLALPDAGRAEAARLDELRLAAEEDHVEARLALGLHHEVVGELRRLVDKHPLREGLWAQHALALYRCGRQAEALEALREIHDLLDRELGVRPGAGLRELQQRMLRADPDLDLRQVVAAAAVPRQLPAAARGFVGRQSELAELDALPDSTGVGLLTGAPGVGKTALALHWAHRVQERFPDGHLHSSGAAPIDVLGRFLRALGVAPERVPTDVDEASSVLRTLLADRRVLILLDNAESADDVRPLLPASNGCFALVTSRDRLDGLVVADGARRLTLSVLPAEESTELLVEALGEQRAAAEPDAVAELADLCGHLPLALRIAAANLANVPFRTLSDGVLDLAAGGLSSLEVPGSGDLAVRRAFDMSYRALTTTAQRLFRRLGLLPGAWFSFESAAALAGAVDLRASLDELAGAHLVVQSDWERFVMHDLLRLYAAELAETFDDAEDRVAATCALVGAYVTAVERAAAGIASVDPDERDQAMRWIEAELPNLVEVAETARTVGRPDAAWRIAEQLGGYFWLSRPVSHWLRLATAAEEAADQAGDKRALASAKRLLGEARHCLGQNDEAIVHLADALALARESGDLVAEAANLMFLGLVEQDRGSLRDAERHFNDCIGIAQSAGDRLMGAGAKGNLGYVRQLMGDHDAAEELYECALSCYDEIDPSSVGSAYNMLALLAHERGRHDDAMKHVSMALSLSQGYDRGVEAHALDTLARVQRDTGELDAALETAQRSTDLAGKLADLRAETDALNTLGSIELLAGRYAGAAERHTNAVALARRSGVVVQQLESLLGAARANLAMGETDAAHELLRDVEASATHGFFTVLAASAQALRASVN